MITIFNRKELISTFNIGIQAAVRDVLSNNHIDYQIKVIGRQSSAFMAGGKMTGTFTGRYGENTNCSTEYTFYVKKSDYDKAAYLLAKNRIY